MKAAFDGIKWSQSVRAELWSYINLDIGLFGSSLSHTHHSPTFLFSLLSSSISAHEIFLFVFSFARWHKLNSYYQSSISAEVIIHSINISNYQVFIGPNIFVIDIVKTCIEFILFNSVQIFDANSTVQRSSVLKEILIEDKKLKKKRNRSKNRTSRNGRSEIK